MTGLGAFKVIFYRDDMNPIWLLRASKWARNPPSKRRIVVILIVVLICAVLFGIEQLWGWPEWLTPENLPRGRFPRL